MHALDDQTRIALQLLLTEIIDGPSDQGQFITNPGDPGLLGSLERLSAAEASARPNGRASVAAHTDHVRYGLSLLNRSLTEANPFADADWTASWLRHTVTEAEWRERRDALKREAHHWRDHFAERTQWEMIALAGTVGSVAHIAYHTGAIRQLSQKAAGPAQPGTQG
jgi:hypothetical protein